MSASVTPKNERAFALAALFWSLGTLTFMSMAWINAGADKTKSVGVWVLFTNVVLFGLMLVTGARVRFALGRDQVSAPLRRLSGGLSAACFVVGVSLLLLAYVRGGDAAIVTTIRRKMPTTLGLSFGVLAAASLCLFLWECMAAVSEIQRAANKRNLVLATLLSLTMALICIAALSSVVVGQMFFMGGS